MLEEVHTPNISLHNLEKTFHLEMVDDPHFFSEWQEHMLPVNEQEKQFLDKMKAGYLNMIKYPPVLEHTVQMAIVAPLLFLADFYLSPFHATSEVSVDVSDVDEEVCIEGKIDILVLREHLWVMVIESKRVALSVEAGLAQLLSYILANPQPDSVHIGLITNGGSFMFIKLAMGDTKNGTENHPKYAVSRIFEMRNPGNDLYTLLGILKQIRQRFL